MKKRINKKLSLKLRLIFVIPAITICVWVILTVHNMNSIQTSVNEMAVKEAALWLDRLSELILDDYRAGNYAKIKRTARSIVEGEVFGSIEIYDRQGDEIYSSVERDIPGGEQDLYESRNLGESADYDALLGKRISVPIRDRYNTEWGSIIFSLPKKEFASVIASQKYRVVLFGLGILLMEISLLILITDRMFKPLEVITNDIDAISRDMPHMSDYLAKFRSNINRDQGDEINRLGKNVLVFLDRIREHAVELSRMSSEAAIGRTTAMIAHDVRKPFAQMKSVLEMLPDKKNDDVFMEYASQQVHESIRKADAMMSDILEYSRDVKLEASDVGVIGMLTSALGDVFKNSEDADIFVEYGYKHTRVVHVEELKIARVFTNILTNAVDAMDRKGKISIQMRDMAVDGKGLIELILANNGPMISDDALPHLFDPFYTKGKKGGTGLGLAICRKIVDAHGGDIRVESTDERTAFIIRLPAGEGREQINEKELIRHSSEIRDLMPLEPVNSSVSEDVKLFLDLHKKRGEKSYLLIVDDEPLFRETIRSLINRIPEVRDNLKVIEADSAEVALKQFEARAFDYVITDIDMGRFNIDGYEYARMVLDTYPKSLVLVHSNKRIHGKDESLLGRKNFQGFLPKPMDEGELTHFLAGKVFEHAERKLYEERKRKKVLVINDEEFMRTALRFELKKTGTVQVIEAAGVSDALRLLKEHSVDVVLADINLGEDRDGYDILREVRAQNTTTRFYMMSGMPKEDEWPKAKEMGADGYIQLPYESTDLRNLLK